MKKVIFGGALVLLAVLVGLLINGKGKPAKEIPWGPEQGGVRLRLAPLAGKFKVGKPMPFRLEMKNVSGAVVEYDSQGFGVNDSFLVTDATGTEVPYIGGSAQTTGGGRPLEPGQIVELVDYIDLADDYLIAERGEFKFQSHPRGPAFGKVAFPASNVVEVTVGKGKLSPAQSLLARLSPILPDDTWEVSVSGDDHIYLVCNRTGLKADLYFIDLRLEEGKLEGERADDFELVGTKNGHSVYWSETPTAEAIDEVWPDHRMSILEAIEIEDS